MRWLVVVILLLSATVFSQPLEGPLNVFQAEEGVTLSDPRIAFTADSAAALFVVQTVADSSTIHNTIFFFGGWARIRTYPFAPGHSVTLEDVAGDEQGGWYFAALEEFGIWSRLSLTTAGDTVTIHEGNWFWPTIVYWESTREAFSRFSHRPGGGTVFSAIFLNQWGIEYDMIPDVRLLPPGSVTAEYTLFEDGQTPPIYLGSFFNAESPAHDSLLLLADEWLINQPTLLSFPQQNPDTLIRVPVQCTVPPPLCAGLSHSGRFLTLHYGPSSGAAGVLEIAPDGSCVERPPVVIPVADHRAAAFHPDYGFAVVDAYPTHIMLVRLDTLGAWALPIGVANEAEAGFTISSVDVDISGLGRVAVAWTEVPQSGTGMSYMRFASVGWNTPLAAGGPPFTPHPSSFTLSAYPNPFNSTLRVNYELPQAQTVELSVFNVLGQKVETLFHGTQTAGVHVARWSPNVAGGIFFVSLKSGREIRTEKVLYLR